MLQCLGQVWHDFASTCLGSSFAPPSITLNGPSCKALPTTIEPQGVMKLACALSGMGHVYVGILRHLI